MATVKSNPKTKKSAQKQMFADVFQSKYSEYSVKKYSVFWIYGKATDFEPLFKNIFFTEQLHMTTSQY